MSAKGRAVRYDPRQADPASEEKPTFVTLDASAYVPLVLSRPPESVPQEDGRIWLRVALAEAYVETLEDFTRANLGGRAAIVLDGEIITFHQVKAVITGGGLQISRCSDRGCEAIRARLIAGGADSEGK